jgi:hypothetical protein
MAKEAWDKREDESSLQYKAFECYMLLDPRVRNMDNAWTRYKEHHENASGPKPSSSFLAWSRRFDWVDRATAFDTHLSAQRRKGIEQGVKQEAKRQAMSIERLRTQLYENFDTVQNTLDLLMSKVQEVDPDKITLAGISNLLRIQLDIAKHLSDDTQGQTPEEELDRMSEDQLAEELFKGSQRERPQESD